MQIVRKASRPGISTIILQLCALTDRCIPAMRAVLLIAGIAAAALKMGLAADFLFATGVVLHLAIWFERWGSKRSTR